MIDVKLLREKPDIFYTSCRNRGIGTEILDTFFMLDEEWRANQKKINDLRHRRNEITHEISRLVKEDKNSTGIRGLKSDVKEVNARIDSLEEDNRKIVDDRERAIWSIPNVLDENAPVCFGDENNVPVRTWGKASVFDDDLDDFMKESRREMDYETLKARPVSHVDLIEDMGLVDLARAGKIAGSRFYFLKNRLLKLEMALMNYTVDYLSERGFSVVEPPLMLNLKSMEGATDLETFSETLYKIEGEDLYLISTSEHPIASMLSGEFLDESELPIRVAGMSVCFRREAGSHGKDTKGIFRVHQFNKIEQFVFCKPEDSGDFLKEILENAEQIYRNLGIPYRVVNVCSGELGRLASIKYDIEAWFPSQGKFREVVSASNDTDYQARSLAIKYRASGGNEFVHTLNSTAIASTRTLVAIMENFQEDGGKRIRVPAPLVPYAGFETIEGVD
ncbi:seryl-tRNA synthetase [uncultured archaeon]|nr:seryl-tRNA synthetase [uncultured archaeon]